MFSTLMSVIRCFGDKGDVEDITEGLQQTFISPQSVGFPSDRSRAEANRAAVNPADIISTVEFDETGNYLATGDKGGRVVLFERNETVGKQSNPHPYFT